MLSIVGLLACADFEVSSYVEVAREQFRFSKLALDTKKTCGVLLFRLYESPQTIILHRSVIMHILETDPDNDFFGWDTKQIMQ